MKYIAHYSKIDRMKIELGADNFYHAVSLAGKLAHPGFILVEVYTEKEEHENSKSGNGTLEATATTVTSTLSESPNQKEI